LTAITISSFSRSPLSSTSIICGGGAGRRKRDERIIERGGEKDAGTYVEHGPRRAQKLGSEFGVGRQSRALAPLALVGQLLQPLREAAVDRLFPCAQINQ